MSYHIGIDAGGTSSKLECYDDEMRLIARQERPGLQAVTMSTDNIIDALGSYVKDICETINSPAIWPDSVACGLAGAGREAKCREIREALQQNYPQVCWYITTDLHAAHAGSFGNKNGILLIAGTGSVVTGRHQEHWFRAGGYGYKVGDEGSGTELGRAAVHAACHCWDGGAQTSLVDLMEQKFDIRTIDELLAVLYQQKLPVSQFAPILPLAAKQGDSVALSLCNRAANALAGKAGLVASRMPRESHRIILHGGLFKSRYYKELVAEKLSEIIGGCTFDHAEYSAPRGALMLKDEALSA